MKPLLVLLLLCASIGAAAQTTSFEPWDREVALYPMAVQANGKFTQHTGTALTLLLHFNERFAMQLTGQYNWYADESSFNKELVERMRQEAQAASSLLTDGNALVGLEVTAFDGDFTWFWGSPARFTLLVNWGAGFGPSKHQLRPGTAGLAPTYGDTGVRGMASFGGGARITLGKHWAFRLEARNLVFDSSVDAVNGCYQSDLKAADAALRSNAPLDSASVSGGCNLAAFSEGDIPLARNLVASSSHDVLSILSIYAGVALTF
jgi:hypothetical protein